METRYFRTYDAGKCVEVIGSLWQMGRELAGNLPAALPEISEYRYGTRSDLERGALCPSLIRDLFIGNVKRGSVRKAPGKNALFYRYGFDIAGRLLLVESLWDGKCFKTEYLQQQGDRRIGVTLDPTGKLMAVSLEQFVDGRLSEYTYLREDYLTAEQYQYDAGGLFRGLWQDYTPVAEEARRFVHGKDHFLRTIELTFLRENGYLASYTEMEYTEDGQAKAANNGNPYLVRVRRKANLGTARD